MLLPASGLLRPSQADPGSQALTNINININIITIINIAIINITISANHLDKYLLSLNCFSSSSSCWEVKAVRGRRVFPRRECG